jgi:hypothetical protein
MCETVDSHIALLSQLPRLFGWHTSTSGVREDLSGLVPPYLLWSPMRRDESWLAEARSSSHLIQLADETFYVSLGLLPSVTYQLTQG